MRIELADFTRLFAEINGLDIARWRFEPGMRHGDILTWWGGKTPRRHVHYGLDFVRYEASDGLIHELEAGMSVPLPARAVIVSIIEDFLGQTVICTHGEHRGRQLIGLYGHVRPVVGIDENIILETGSVIAELAHPGPSRSRVPAHLHLGLALLPEGTAIETLSWDYLNSNKDVEHIDPIELL